ncbi:hypothetical protein [Fictibacillus macauensis]|uniref:hypothetical protein n=1 Tax=Fictibacillus macauensis TaxID=245160 RepID=UPI0002DA6A40|nr:hypothetical protein [Fictibacillus macauensis]
MKTLLKLIIVLTGVFAIADIIVGFHFSETADFLNRLSKAVLALALFLYVKYYTKAVD